MTAAQRAWLAHVRNAKVAWPTPALVQARVANACKKLGWTEKIWSDGTNRLTLSMMVLLPEIFSSRWEHIGDCITDAGRKALDE